jgi:hypothetical protein
MGREAGGELTLHHKSLFIVAQSASFLRWGKAAAMATGSNFWWAVVALECWSSESMTNNCLFSDWMLYTNG